MKRELNEYLPRRKISLDFAESTCLIESSFVESSEVVESICLTESMKAVLFFLSLVLLIFCLYRSSFIAL